MNKKNFFSDKTKGMAILYMVMVGFVLLCMVTQIWLGEFENVFTCVLTLFLFLIPTIANRTFKITLPHTLEVIIVFFIFSAEILGEINAFYEKISWWDSMLHAMNGFLMAGVGFSMVDILNQSDRVKMSLSPIFVVIVAFCFSMTIGVLWEFFEFGMDLFANTDMQKDYVLNAISSVSLDKTLSNTQIEITGIEDVMLIGQNLNLAGQPVEGGKYLMGLGGYLDIGIFDTMKDMIVNFIGAVVFSIIGYFYLKGRGKGTFAKRFIPHMNKSKL
ncbi:MAG: hypothetical protein RSA27_04295 [Oscillospiraceae bacterium]